MTSKEDRERFYSFILSRTPHEKIMKFNQYVYFVFREAYEGDFSYCSCDSESCADSNKCYCPGPHRTSMQTSQSLEYLRSPSQKTYSDRMKRAFDDYEDHKNRR
jgi:hypothetical protein